MYFNVCRLWKDVTHNLKIKDIDKATDAKHFLEERQRNEAKERKEFSLQWETKVNILPVKLSVHMFVFSQCVFSRRNLWGNLVLQKT